MTLSHRRHPRAVFAILALLTLTLMALIEPVVGSTVLRSPSAGVSE